jgi:hypothetical protein
MDFFLRNKLLTFLILLGVVYWFVNKPGKFGLATKNIVVYDRVPIPFFDLYVNVAGKKIPVENLNKPLAFENLCDTLARLKSASSQVQITLVVGTGFTEQKLFSLQGRKDLPETVRWTKVEEMPSRAAITRYNALVDAKMPVAIILKVKDH